MNYVVDSCVFNWLVSKRVSISDLPQDGEYVATHVQRDELGCTPSEPRRSELLARFGSIVKRNVQTESVVLGVSRIGHCRLSDGVLCESIRTALDAANKSKPNNSSDALIAEVAIANGWTLITADKDLAKVAQQHGGLVHLVQG